MTEKIPHKDGIETAFDNLIFMADEYITLPTAAQLAQELGLSNYDPLDYDH